MEFATEEEMREMLGDNAKGYNVGYGWRSLEEPEVKKEVKTPGKVLIGCFVGSCIMYIAAKSTTFNKAAAKQFDNTDATDTKIRMMNRNGFYSWKKIPVT